MSIATHHVTGRPQTVSVRAGSVFLDGKLWVRDCSRAVVVILNGCSRHIPREIEAELHSERFATFKVELLTRGEQLEDVRSGKLRFNAGLLAQRVIEVTDALRRDSGVRDLPLVFLGTGAGAAAALIASADDPARAQAIISCDGRPDLAGAIVAGVMTPTLLMVGGDDYEMLKCNHQAYAMLRCEKQLPSSPTPQISSRNKARSTR